MAFYRNYGNGTDADHVLDEKGQDDSNRNGERNPSILGNGELDGSSSDKDAEGKTDDQYQSEEEFVDDSRVQDGADGNLIANSSQNFQQPGRRTALVGKWGSSFWKDCQPLFNQAGSESARGSKEMDSDYKSEDESESNSSDGRMEQVESENYDGHKDTDEAQRGQADVPTDEMLSDEYYEQDGEEQSESYNYREPNRSAASNSRHLSKSVAAKKNISRNLKNANSYDYSDDDYNDEDDDDEDEDDPDDTDFDPSYGDTGGRARKKGSKEWDSDDNDEEEDNDDDLDIYDEDDMDYIDSPRHKKRKAKRNSHSRETKSFSASARKKRRKIYLEEEESSTKDTEQDSDEDFGHRINKGTKLRKKSSGRPSVSANIIGHSREVRTSSRPVKKVSYVESEESEEVDEERMKKSQKLSQEEAEEDDGDGIEKVLWHQPIGMSQDAMASNKSILPVVSCSFLDSEPDMNEMEFFIKMKGQSYLHCQWKSYSDLQNLSGFKKVLNYIKRVKEEWFSRKNLSREEGELYDLSKEMELDLLKQYSQVERIFADKLSKSDSDHDAQEYLVKWKGLSYAEATWEKDTEIAFAQDAIDEYKAREAAMTIQGKMVDFQRKKSKASLRKLDEQPEWLKGGKLRDYQLEGLNFLVNSWRNDTNVILADEMGLGKTVQSVSMLGFLQNAQQIHGPFLVVVPLSTLTNWAKEFRKWLPDMNIVVYVGNRRSREVCQQYEFYPNKKTGRNIKFNTLLTTYEVVLKDRAVFSKIKWSYLMVDEAHRLKNSEASLYTTLSEFSTKNKLLITGTPLQNSVEELWALLHFLDPEKFKSKDDFSERYKNLSSFNENELADLHKELRPHLLRRVIKDVEKSLPPKFERILRVEMSPLQKQYYKWILERNFHNLNKGVRGNQVSLLNIVVELKKCCNHPFLFESADHGYGGDANMKDCSKIDRIVLSSGKLVLLDKLLIRLRETNHRVLIFSQMVRMLDILAEYLSFRGFQFQRLDGSTKADLRHQAMEHFNAPGSDDFCFLLSTRAGGLGINLATADTVIIFDSDWNPQNDLQAMSRAHRIGQREVVNIYRFVTSRSVEEDILERAKKKMVLDHLVIQKLNAEGRLEKKETKKGSSMFDKNELSAILRFGAEELFKEEKNDEENKRRLENMDIDEILERAEKVESKGTEGEPGNELLGAFKVANFASTEDDGTFWSRWIQPEAVAQAEEALAPRAARNTKSYAEANQVEKITRKKKGSELQERVSKRYNKVSDFAAHSVPMIEGAAAYVRECSIGYVSKKDAARFVRSVKKFGDQSKINLIVAEVGGAIGAAPVHAQTELLEGLIDGCREAIKGGNAEGKGTLLDFFGVPVKAHELLDRVQELQLLSKRINRYQDPISQFRLITHPRNPPWSKGCGWNQVDDARLLLGIHFHGYGNWEKIRLDSGLGLTRKMAPAKLLSGETFLPRAPNLDARASALLRKEFEVVSDKKAESKAAGKHTKRESEYLPRVSSSRSKDLHQKSDSRRQSARINNNLQKRQKIEPKVKEEGEISESEDPERYRQYKEEKWREWCADVMSDEIRTLKRLEKLQTTSVDLPKEKVLFKIRNYLQILGEKIDRIVQEHATSHNHARMTIRLWKYVATFSNMPGDRLSQIYRKLKQEQQAETGVAQSQFDGSTPGPSGRDGDPSQYPPLASDSSNPRPFHKTTPYNTSEVLHGDQDTGKSEAWKRRRRTDRDNELQAQPVSYNGYPQPLGNGNRLHEVGSSGILGWGPGDNRRFSGDRWNRKHQPHLPPGPGHQSELK